MAKLVAGGVGPGLKPKLSPPITTDYQRKPIVMGHVECLASCHRNSTDELDQNSSGVVVH